MPSPPTAATDRATACPFPRRICDRRVVGQNQSLTTWLSQLGELLPGKNGKTRGSLA